uniref:SKP1 component dimerisation domain-containing protein n=1 Tax=Neobodo designis TaxID=312471 RepID=A0A7S1R3Z3_NEODS|mmetsp:Transcript_803/g.2778  ORF Transcript_803/g.2778 Transcript_803/m.2778 type:complete len:224 (+) Transcript_803:46-717(+)|eukprot:CAMPEP_0174851252 /NCGR_PEP_ID=MMETSP1114-20130205/22533_1 /TAXON_ID=312471 /ORGANISM="Neobodo designis, Strain CCAP 1951/1" /LENGTH=223 /DNA_ID=CAMNT_0016085775 /DNA_START=45 /DNA_END=716 /DNA_ORIENTATION=+
MAAPEPQTHSAPLNADTLAVARGPNGLFSPPINAVTHVVLQSNESEDAVFFAMPRGPAEQGSELFREMISSSMPEDPDEEPAVIPTQADAWTLSRCCAYMLFHYNNPAPEIEKPMTRPVQTYIGEWDKRFLFEELLEDGDEAKHDGLLNVMEAAHNLNMKPLLELCGACVANSMRGKDVEEIRALYKVVQDQTPEQLERIRKSNEVFDKAMGLQAQGPVAAAE